MCEAVIADLERLGYVDDAALARSLAERRLAQGWGAARVECDLARLGVEAEPALEAVALARQGEAEAARALVERRGLAVIRVAPGRCWRAAASPKTRSRSLTSLLGPPLLSRTRAPRRGS